VRSDESASIAATVYEGKRSTGAPAPDAFRLALRAYEALERARRAHNPRRPDRAQPFFASPRVASVMERVIAHHHVPINRSRRAASVAVRDEVVWLLRELRLPLRTIGGVLGGKHHTTVMASLQRFEIRMATDPALAARMTAWAAELNAAG
jgi:hypothetical protein